MRGPHDQNYNGRGRYENNGGAYDRSGYKREYKNDGQRNSRSRGESRGGYHNNNRFSHDQQSNANNFDQQTERGRASDYQNDRQRNSSSRGGFRENHNNRAGGQTNFRNEETAKVEPGPIELMTNFFEVRCLDTTSSWFLYQVFI